MKLQNGRGTHYGGFFENVLSSFNQAQNARWMRIKVSRCRRLKLARFDRGDGQTGRVLLQPKSSALMESSRRAHSVPRPAFGGAMLTLLRVRRAARLRRRPELDGASRPLLRAGSWQPSFCE